MSSFLLLFLCSLAMTMLNRGYYVAAHFSFHLFISCMFFTIRPRLLG